MHGMAFAVHGDLTRCVFVGFRIIRRRTFGPFWPAFRHRSSSLWLPVLYFNQKTYLDCAARERVFLQLLLPPPPVETFC